MKEKTWKDVPLLLQCQYRTSVALVVVMLLCSTDCQVLSAQDSTPRITREITVQQKANRIEVKVGAAPYFAIEVQGAPPLQYVWSQDGVVIQNDTQALLVIGSAQTSQSGIYRCLVYNRLGSTRSLPFSLVVKELGVWPQTPDVTVQVEERKFVVLKMPAISYVNDPSFFRIVWLREDQMYLSSGLNTYIALDHSLVILNVPLTLDGSRFQVKLVHNPLNDGQETVSHNFVLNVAASSDQSTFIAPEIVIPPKNVTAVAGTIAKMECVIYGLPLNNLQVTWFKGDGATRTIINAGFRFDLGSDMRVLTISPVLPEDAGVYSCEGIVNQQGQPVVGQATLTVLVPPSFLHQSSRLPLIKDYQESFELECKASGIPPPRIQWYFNGALLAKDTTDSLQRYKIDANNTLSIASVDLPDSGVYQCFADNSAGERNAYTQLFVNSAPPTLVQAPKDKTVEEGKDTSFTCEVIGGPRPEIYWTKDGVNLTVGGRIRISQTQHELLIGEAKLTDSGLYKCNAVNIKGTVAAEATLTVVVKTQIIRPPQNKSRILSSDTEMECGVRSDPTITPTWTWFFSTTYSEPVQITEVPGNREITADGTLKLYSIIGDDSGVYECVVTSDGGNDRREATLNVIELPTPPVINAVVLNDELPNSVRINWTQGYDGHTPIIKFIIQSRLESFSTGSTSESSWETINSNVNPALRSIVIEDLLPSKFYRFRMIAVNRVNESPPSEPAPTQAIKMPAQPPSEAPKNLYCRPQGERKISVGWDPPPTSSWNGDLQGYYVYYKISAFGDEKRVDVKGSETRETIIDFLAFNMQYRVVVAAYNEKGAGVQSGPYYVTTLQGKPSAPPTNVALSSPNSTTIKVEWDPPDTRSLNGINQGYDIDVFKGRTLDRVEDVRFDASNPTGRQVFLITNLLKYTEYKIQIACKTVIGLGPKSSEKTLRTLEDVPGPVKNLKIESTAQQNMYFTWEPPEYVNGILEGYEIVHQKKSGSSPAVSEMRGPNATSHTLMNLVYDSVYNISVRAKTRVGFGPSVKTEFSSAMPPEKPTPPTQLAVLIKNIQARSATLQFRPGFDGRATINLWIIEAQIEDDKTWQEIYTIQDPGADEIRVKNLRPYTFYTLRIIAQNVFARSEPSEPGNRFLTKQDVPGAAPEDVTPRATSPKSIKVIWKQVPRSEWNGDFLGYKIFYRRWSTDFNLNTTSQTDLDLVREKAWSEVTLRNGSDIQGYTLSGLEEWMEYQVQMAAYNAVGNGVLSELEVERTSEGVPNGYPLNIEPRALAPTSIRVTWSSIPILQQNGNIRGYKVKYKARGSQEEAKFQKVEGAATMDSTLTDLRMFVEYDIQVLAYSRIGDGVLSPKVTIRTLAGAPGPPVNIWFPDVSESSVTIVWEAPDEPNGVISRYKVAWRREDEPNTQMKSVDKNTNGPLSHTVSDLVQETMYVFSVTARTQDDWGEDATVKVYTISGRDRPNPPYNVRIGTSEIKARSMDIYWSEGNTNFGPIRNYTVQYRKRGSLDWEEVKETIGPDVTVYIVHGLQPNSFYSFRVAATNDLGSSDFSDPSMERQTREDKPDGAPQEVAIVPLTRESIKITWQPPPEDTWNGFVLQDIVLFREENAEEYRETPPIPFGTFTTTLERLTIGRYEIRVVSENSAGRGPPSVLQVFRVGDIAPFRAPQDLQVTNKSSSELQVSWTAPPKDTTNGDIIGYKVLFWPSPSEACLEDEVTGVKQRSVTEEKLTLVGLTPHTLYCVTVEALNIAGYSPPTLPGPQHTSEDLPSPPTDLRFRNITLKELVVLWNPPKFPNGDIIKYELQYFATVNDEKTFISQHMIPGQERQFYVSNLLENQRYTFQLAAFTSIGRGNVSECSRCECCITTGPQAGSPEAPLRPVMERQDKYLMLTWVNQGEGNSPIYAYHVRYREMRARRKRDDGSDAWIPIMEVSSAQPQARINLNDLKPSTDYQFRVRAVNAQGISPPSPATSVYTTPASLVSKKAKAFHTEWWFLVIVALTGVIIITLLCYVEKRRNKGKEMKRSTTATTVMSTPEPQDGGFPLDIGFPSLEMGQSRRSLARNGKIHNNIYARSPPRPSPASVTYSEDIPPPIAGAAAAIKPPLSEDNSSVLSEKPSNLGDSSPGDTSDSDDSSDNSIAKAPVPSSPPPPAFSRASASNSSSHYPGSQRYSESRHQQAHPNRSTRSARSRLGRHSNSSSSNPTPTADLGDGAEGGARAGPSWRFQRTNNAYTYTDSEAESSHYAFSLNNGNIVVNNVAGARTPLAGFSSFV
ncbi:hypothetical protein EGW08_017255 [Elysia chlorotica]|uniref:Protein sidekick n=1 Tax=Elysia chlorotica TaxID=188477 RepID=A0A3S1B4S6_ELYCH|nr:hypothetical protein EGW08_017255 [Elysia chlorotica]